MVCSQPLLSFRVSIADRPGRQARGRRRRRGLRIAARIEDAALATGGQEKEGQCYHHQPQLCAAERGVSGQEKRSERRRPAVCCSEPGAGEWLMAFVAIVSFPLIVVTPVHIGGKKQAGQSMPTHHVTKSAYLRRPATTNTRELLQDREKKGPPPMKANKQANHVLATGRSQPTNVANNSSGRPGLAATTPFSLSRPPGVRETPRPSSFGWTR